MSNELERLANAYHVRATASAKSRIEKQLRNGGGLLVPTDWPPVAKAIGEVLADTSGGELRLQAALALGDFTQSPGVVSRLMAAAVARHESIDLWYAAFTSIERAGPTPKSIALLHELARDEALGGAARSVLSARDVG